MLTLTNRRTRDLKSFKDFEHLYAAITAYEEARQAIMPQEPLRQWGLTRYGYGLVILSEEEDDEEGDQKVMKDTQKPLEESVLRALAQGEGMGWKERWCRAYCVLHGFGIMESPSYSDDPPASFEEDL